MPNRNGETSIYRVSGITELEIWGIGDKYVREPIASKQGACVLQGWAEVNADIILGQSLTVIPKPRPHPRHADIMGWPNEKAEKQMLATEIANVANLHLPSI